MGLKFLQDCGNPDVTLHVDTSRMQTEEADPAQAIRIAGDKLGYLHVGESDRGDLGCGTVAWEPVFDALLAIDYDRDVESFSAAIADENLSRACALWRDTWQDNGPLAAHAKQFIEMKLAEAQRRLAASGAN